MNLAQQLTAPTTEILSSRLMPEIIGRVAEASPLMVLDAGLGVRETVEYFGSRRCKLHFSNFYEVMVSPPLLAPPTRSGKMVDEAARQEALLDAWRERFQATIDFPAETRFHLCLFWDVFSYLDDMALKAFSEVIRPYLTKDTVGHAFLQMKQDPQVVNREYGLQTPDQIAMRPGRLDTLTTYPRPQAKVTGLFKSFAVSHSVLRRDGLVEASLKTQ